MRAIREASGGNETRRGINVMKRGGSQWRSREERSSAANVPDDSGVGVAFLPIGADSQISR